MTTINSTDLFHVHTYRCGHAEDVEDEAYVKKALELGAKGIWFTDHAPFPGNPFGNRMKYEMLESYVEDIFYLKEKYKGIIDIHIGLETEYFPSYDKQGYYEELRSNTAIEMLALGQHMAEIGNKTYSFSWDKETLKDKEYIALGEAVVMGIQTGYFDVCVHPDRIFRRKNAWNRDMQSMAERIWNVANIAGIPLEQNAASKTLEHQYWDEFWEMAQSYTDIAIIQGLDAHSIAELTMMSKGDSKQ